MLLNLYFWAGYNMPCNDIFFSSLIVNIPLVNITTSLRTCKGMLGEVGHHRSIKKILLKIINYYTLDWVTGQSPDTPPLTNKINKNLRKCACSRMSDRTLPPIPPLTKKYSK